MQHYVYKCKRILICFSNTWVCLQEVQNVHKGTTLQIEIMHLLFNIFLHKGMKEQLPPDKSQQDHKTLSNSVLLIYSNTASQENNKLALAKVAQIWCDSNLLFITVRIAQIIWNQNFWCWFVPLPYLVLKNRYKLKVLPCNLSLNSHIRVYDFCITLAQHTS